MVDITATRKNIRVPNLPVGKWVNEDGSPTDDFLTFMQGLLGQLQRNGGNEGLVVPTQSSSDTLLIQNNTSQQYVNGPPSFTCQFGTMIFVANTNPPSTPSNDSFLIAMDSGDAMNSPLFKHVIVNDGTEMTAGAIAGYMLIHIGSIQYKIALYAPT